MYLVACVRSSNVFQCLASYYYYVVAVDLCKLLVDIELCFLVMGIKRCSFCNRRWAKVPSSMPGSWTS